mmetsp:Transcript_12527/g.38642  ORF Transcript_12527/g.38642 Transcript_12527/m.38642 type:complete len:227 (-) Transcript_12527:58-738(-)
MPPRLVVRCDGACLLGLCKNSHGIRGAEPTTTSEQVHAPIEIDHVRLPTATLNFSCRLEHRRQKKYASPRAVFNRGGRGRAHHFRVFRRLRPEPVRGQAHAQGATRSRRRHPARGAERRGRGARGRGVRLAGQPRRSGGARRGRGPPDAVGREGRAPDVPLGQALGQDRKARRAPAADLVLRAQHPLHLLHDGHGHHAQEPRRPERRRGRRGNHIAAGVYEEQLRV